MLYVPVNTLFQPYLDVLPVFKQRIKCLAQEDDPVPLMSFEPANHRPKVSYSTTDPRAHQFEYAKNDKKKQIFCTCNSIICQFHVIKTAIDASV